MNIMTKNRLSKSLLGITLSVSLFASTNLLIAPQSAHAASTASTTAASTSISGKANSIIATGKQYLGVRYKFGAPKGQTNSFDCSSFTQNVYGKNGINLPRSSKQQSQVGTYVDRSQLQPGDLVFFYSPIHHVGIYMGNGKILHTYGSPGVTISDMNSGWWSKNYKTARRVIH
ncbi:C40 family peptidase [Paenibacillus aceris]|uniref:Cell wall-associated NlpC family hydrolase n=1 Tax=Paenibacillus aceris TaxID=869555 RepID=A0ABS4I033_9BACL|nr:C40 family peptidase [Paenibacillus aceris]MBP1964273.1 cell wall-associated NlpC family hydrolase [Paenibacillus aceris]